MSPLGDLQKGSIDLQGCLVGMFHFVNLRQFSFGNVAHVLIQTKMTVKQNLTVYYFIST